MIEFGSYLLKNFDTLFGETPFGVVLYEPVEGGEDFIIKAISKSVERIEDVERNNIVGMRVGEVFEGVKETPIFEAFCLAYKNKESKSVQSVLYKDDNRVGYRRNYVTYISPSLLLVIYADDTEAEIYSLLKESESIMEFGVIEVDFEKSSEFWSDGFYALIGDVNRSTKPAYLKALEFVHMEDKEDVQTKIKRIEESGIYIPYECRLVGLDGGVRDCRFSGDFRVREDGDRRLIVIVQDISSEIKVRKLEEEQRMLLTHKRHLESLQEMFVNISHHWRQPLTIISMIATNMLEEFEEGSLDKMRLEQNIKNIENEVNFLGTTISQHSLLVQRARDIKDIDIYEEIEAAILIHRPLFDKNGIEIVKNLKHIKIYGYASEITRTVSAMVQNSMDSILNKMQKDSGFRGKIEIEIFEEERAAKIVISDNGSGVDGMIAERIFEPYFTTKFKSRGVGLNLSVCYYNIKNLFDGDIYLDAGYKEGARFVITLPCSK